MVERTRVPWLVVLAFWVTVLAACAKRPPSRWAEMDDQCGPGSQAYHTVGPGSAADQEAYPDCSVLHWDDARGGGVALCCPGS